jgi:hypothetical protein
MIDKNLLPTAPYSEPQEDGQGCVGAPPGCRAAALGPLKNQLIKPHGRRAEGFFIFKPYIKVIHNLNAIVLNSGGTSCYGSYQVVQQRRSENAS